VNFYEVTNPTTGVTWTGMSSALSIGVFSSSGSTANTRAVMSNFSITASTVSLSDADIGSPGVAGSATTSAGLYTVNGGGSDTWNTSDQFNYYSESATGNDIMIVHVNSMQNTDPWAKSGLMFRNSLIAGSAFVALYENPSGLVEMQWRDTDNAFANWPGGQVGVTGAVNWLELIKTGNTFTAYYATTTGTPGATDWMFVASHATTFTNSTFLAGLAVTAHNNSLLNTTVFSQLSVQSFATQTLTLSDLDIGSVGFPGLAMVNGGIYTVEGSGADIWYTSDEFNYCYQSNTTDKTMIVHVDSMQNTNSWARAGIMFRNSTIPGAAFVGLYQNPSGVVELQWRDTDNVSANWGGSQVGVTGAANWLKLVKSGSSFTAYYATTTTTPAATDWVLVAVHSTTFTNSTYLGGLVVGSHDNTQLNTSVFSGFSEQ
jgi:hypothetical protein